MRGRVDIVNQRLSYCLVQRDRPPHCPRLGESILSQAGANPCYSLVKPGVIARNRCSNRLPERLSRSEETCGPLEVMRLRSDSGETSQTALNPHLIAVFPA